MKKRKTIMLLVTYGCNLRCSYCYEPKKVNRHITTNQAHQYICRQVEKAVKDGYDEFEVQFMGGEPLMVFPLVKEVCEWLWQQKFDVPLVQVFAATNGTLLTDDMRRWLTDNKERICLGLSFDGDRLMQNVNRSGSASMVDLGFFATTWPKQSVKMTVAPDTMSRLAEGVAYLRSQGFHSITADLAMGAGIEWEPSHLEELARQLQLVAEDQVLHPEQLPISLLNIDVLAVLHNRGKNKKCGCGEHLVCIDTDGTEYACHLFAPITAGDEKAQASLNINFAQHELFVSSVCRQCLLRPLCTTCYGMNYLHRGDVALQDSFTCQTFKIQYLTACDLHHRLAIARGDITTARKIETVIHKFQTDNNHLTL